MRRVFDWRMMTKEVYQTVRDCNYFHKTTVSLRENNGFLKLFLASYLFEFVTMNLLGPFHQFFPANYFMLNTVLTTPEPSDPTESERPTCRSLCIGLLNKLYHILDETDKRKIRPNGPKTSTSTDPCVQSLS